MPFSPRAGKNARVTVDGTPLFLSEFEVEDKGDDLDTTTFENNGFETGVIGIEVATLTFKGIWNAAANPYDDPPGLFPRDDLTNVNLFENIADNKFWDFPFVRVISSRNSAAVRDFVKFDPSMKSNGFFVRPTGSV